MSLSVGLTMVLASVWIAFLGSSFPRKGLAWRLCRSSAALWGGYVAAILCLLYSAGMALSDLLAYGGVSFWLGLNLVYSSCFWVVPAAVVLSAITRGLSKRGKEAQGRSVGRAWLARAVAVLCLVLLGTGFYASLYEPNAVRLNVLNLHSPKLLAASGELRIVQLSDLHMSRLGIRGRRALALVQEARPDLILLTGDYLSSPKAAPAARNFLSRLHAPLGVFAVTGAGDEHFDLSRIFDGTQVRLLHNEGVRPEAQATPVRVIGLTWDKPDMKRAFADAQPNELTILLSQSPRLFESRPPADLILAGQTHGGQVGIPFLRDRIISYLRSNPKYYGGLFRKGRQLMYVSPGLGMENGDAPQIRFLAPPEVTLIIVRGAGRG